jgi:predicted RNase H-like HicB family nuclease
VKVRQAIGLIENDRAIAFHLEGLASAGEPAPEPSSGAGVYVAHAA